MTHRLTREERRLNGRADIATVGFEKPLVAGKERVCPTCHLAYWIAGGHDCDRKPARPLTWAARKYGTDWDGYLDAQHDNHEH